jgi:hypothetical protein
MYRKSQISNRCSGSLHPLTEIVLLVFFSTTQLYPSSLHVITMDPLKVELGEYHNGIQEKKSIHFLDLLDITYDADATATGFYYHYRSSVLTSLKKKGDIIAWQNNLVLPVDEELSPTFEEMILANVLGLINPLLPALVRDHYIQVINKNKSK